MNLVRVKTAPSYCLLDFSSPLQALELLYNLKSIMQNLNLFSAPLREVCEFLRKPVPSFQFVIKPQAGKFYVVLSFTANISHYSNSRLLLSVMPFESAVSVVGFISQRSSA